MSTQVFLFIILNGIIRNTWTAQDVPSSKAKNTLILVRTLEYNISIVALNKDKSIEVA
jgi:hypothetical protein